MRVVLDGKVCEFELNVGDYVATIFTTREVTKIEHDTIHLKDSTSGAKSTLRPASLVKFKEYIIVYKSYQNWLFPYSLLNKSCDPGYDLEKKAVAVINTLKGHKELSDLYTEKANNTDDILNSLTFARFMNKNLSGYNSTHVILDKEEEMNTVTPVIVKKYEVLGTNIFVATPDELISVITKLKAEIDRMVEISNAATNSVYINGRIAKLEKAMDKVVKELDSRIVS